MQLLTADGEQRADRVGGAHVLTGRRRRQRDVPGGSRRVPYSARESAQHGGVDTQLHATKAAAPAYVRRSVVHSPRVCGSGTASSTGGTVGRVDVEVGERGIRLGQLLKLVNLVDTGGAARGLLEAGEVRVNGEVETRRGRQLAPGDVVECAGEQVSLR